MCNLGSLSTVNLKAAAVPRFRQIRSEKSEIRMICFSLEISVMTDVLLLLHRSNDVTF